MNILPIAPDNAPVIITNKDANDYVDLPAIEELMQTYKHPRVA